MITHRSFNYSFDPSQCESCGGACCLGETGFVWISEEEIVALANYLAIPHEELRTTSLFNVDHRYSIRERQLSNGDYACIYFDMDRECCSIYSVRPEQCRTFPFWDEYLIAKDETFYMCHGIRKKRSSKGR